MGDASLALSGGDASLESEEGSSAGDFLVELAHVLALVAAILVIGAGAVNCVVGLNGQEVVCVAGLAGYRLCQFRSPSGSRLVSSLYKNYNISMAEM